MSYEEAKQAHDEQMARVRAALDSNDPREAAIAELRAQLAAATKRAEDAEALRQVYAALLVAGMREVVRLSDAPDKIAAATAYYAKLFELAQEFGMLDKCDEAAIAAVAKRVGVPIEYARA